MSESEIISKYLKLENRERIKTLVESKNGRKKFLKSLSHNFIDKVDPKFIKRINGNKSEIIKVILNHFKKKEFQIISENSEFEKNNYELIDALENIIGFGMGTIIYSIDGSLMYYEGEDINERYIISKNAI